ncbi:MAG: hypothetical protein V9E81_15880 [Marmoricola sp.]
MPYQRNDDGSLTLVKSTPALARAISIASGLGTTSAYTWLKMPACDDPQAVYASTTLPCVVLGGVPNSRPRCRPGFCGVKPWHSRVCAAWWSAEPCSTHQMMTWLALWRRRQAF